MQKLLPKLAIAGVLTLLLLSFFAASPVRAACGQGAGECLAPPYAVAAEPVWATLNATPQGNYPGGNEIFDVVVVNSDHPPAENVTLLNESISAAALPPSDSNPNTAIGLPVSLSPGQLIVNTIAMEIPSNFTHSNFTASLVVNVSYWNGTLNIPLRLTGNLIVYMLGLPLSGGQTSTTGTSSGTQSTVTVTQSGSVSSSLFAVGVGIPLIVVVILLVLLVRGRGAPKGP
jgi:hypothetical protein